MKTRKELKCMHDWAWSVDKGCLGIACKNEGCEYYAEKFEDTVHLIKFREIMFTEGRESRNKEILKAIDKMTKEGWWDKSLDVLKKELGLGDEK